ncbi:MAG: type II secretion system protein GspN [Candidatus Electronema sp. V4]|uniref:type II secretion system protein GspN n=1 Tax=Candidatus Electronema sp. V4 TaxID=3454756 RepID=UPI0040554B7D
MRMMRMLGYLLYAVAALLFMLWLQFPAAAVKAKAESELNRLAPGLRWQIGSVGLALPADLRFSQITISGEEKSGQPLIIESLSLRPDFAAWRKNGSWSAFWRLRLLGGSGDGRLGLNKARSGLDYSGELRAVSLEHPGLKPLLEDFGRTLSGSFSASFSGSQDVRLGLFAELKGEVRIEKGAVSLQEPVLGMEQLAFDQLRGKIKSQGGTLLLQDGKLESKLLAADFSGDLRLTQPAASSPVRLKGGLNPRPELLASLGGGPIAASLLKSRLQNGKLPFTITGPLNAPGIVFSGLPADFSSQLGRGGNAP